MRLNDNERVLLAKHYCEETLKRIERGPVTGNGGWDSFLLEISELMFRGGNFCDVAGSE